MAFVDIKRKKRKIKSKKNQTGLKSCCAVQLKNIYELEYKIQKSFYFFSPYTNVNCLNTAVLPSAGPAPADPPAGRGEEVASAALPAAGEAGAAVAGPAVRPVRTTAPPAGLHRLPHSWTEHHRPDEPTWRVHLPAVQLHSLQPAPPSLQPAVIGAQKELEQCQHRDTLSSC